MTNPDPYTPKQVIAASIIRVVMGVTATSEALHPQPSTLNPTP